ncbi:hypothetical protein MSG28_004733 [Choristoneura fumiferana]|uniref:Uncharacterized protein n=1 Tax=Choristoneura fumiferana TaxID=7141 RepID=A0ACC0K7B7_CHOFU|nr:hypothetical protein MSG28_004733 [Choristoneura fumiferana]
MVKLLIPSLLKLSQTLMLVKNFHWIVIEDSEKKTKLVENLLKESTIKYTHLNVKTNKAKHSTASGVEQRNLALDFLRKYLQTPEGAPGVVFFMDDDNTYSLKVFEEVSQNSRFKAQFRPPKPLANEKGEESGCMAGGHSWRHAGGKTLGHRWEGLRVQCSMETLQALPP